MNGMTRVAYRNDNDLLRDQELPRVCANAVWDGEFNLVVWSEGCIDFWLNPRDILRPGMPMIELLRHLAQSGAFGDGDHERLAQQELARIKYAGPDSDEELRMANGHTIRISRNALQGGGYVSSYFDLTGYLEERDQRENLIADYRLAADISNMGHWLWDEINHRMISCSEECADIHGVSVDELLASTRSIESDLEWVHPKDREVYLNTMETEDRYDIEFSIIDRTGEIRHVREVCEPEHDANGKVIRSRGIIQDITAMVDARMALEVSERRYKEIFDEAPIALWIEDWSKVKIFIDKLNADGITDLRRYFTDNHDKLCELYDLSDTVETSRASLALYGTDDRSMYLDYLASEHVLSAELEAFLEILIGLTQGQWQFETESEDTTWLDHNIIVLSRGIIPPAYRDDWSRLIYSMEDVTDKRKAQAEREIAMHNAEKANRAKTVFLANMSHELRTPLNAIIGYSDAVSQQMFGPLQNTKYQEYVKDIYVSGRHLLDLVNDVLDISKIEAGAETLTDAEIDLGEMVQSCIPLVTGSKQGGTIHLDIETQDNLPKLRADGRLVKQILINILSNAYKFSNDNGRVVVRLAKADNGSTTIVVNDDGIGIALVDIPKVLEPFGQARIAANTQTEGTGLGLPLAKRLMEMHGGTLHLQSQLGSGTTVTMRFPAERTL